MKISQLSIRSGRKELPLVPMRELVVFPHMVIPFFVGRKASIAAVQAAMNQDKTLFLACQKNTKENPERDDIHPVGTITRILQILKLPDGTIRVLVEGQERGVIDRYIARKDNAVVQVQSIKKSDVITPEMAAMMKTLQTAFGNYLKMQKKSPKDARKSAENAEYPDKLVDIICANANLKSDQKIEILATTDTEERMEKLIVLLESENQVLSLQSKINTKVKKKLEQNQKEYFLNEQLKQINKELGRDENDPSGAADLEKKIIARKPPQEVLDKASKEAKRLSRLQPMSPESGVLRTYLEWLADLPWSERSNDNDDIEKAARILDEDHYSLKKAKERILDFLAVLQLKEKIKGPILCLVGPPGTGKTSLGKSIARALNREFLRISLGGVRDEAEIRGHRKTYVGALPGKIIQSMRKVGTINPVFLLDEIDKLDSDFRGDPASALLEVLDPEQNATFIDHYLEVPYDLSSVMFITTANSLHSIPYPLLDRMEVIEIPGYTDYEKIHIAREFIIRKQLEANGLEWADIRFQNKAIESIIHNYTMESGVRNLEREIGTIIRKIAREAVKQGIKHPAENEPAPNFSRTITSRGIGKYLGISKFQEDRVDRTPKPGLVHGMAWTEMGGTLLPVEVAVIPGSGELILTGSLGDVMKESARTALSYIRAHHRELSLPSDFQKKKDIHIHVPEGAIPKDGPSAGITMTVAMVSALLDKATGITCAMTGEITLTGRVLPIGGLKEKVLAAYRNDIHTIIVPKANRKHTEELPKEIMNALDFHFTDSILDVLRFLFPVGE